MITRRRVVQGWLLLFGSHPLDALRLLSAAWTSEAAAEPAAVASAPNADQLSQSEKETLLAFAEVLVEGRRLPAVERGHLLDHIVDRARDDEYVVLYRTLVGVLDRLAGGGFARLDIPRRIDLIRRHRLAFPGAPEERSSAPDTEVHGIRTRVVPDLVAGYYGSPAGWAAVEYDSFPGVCTDLLRYTRPQA